MNVDGDFSGTQITVLLFTIAVESEKKSLTLKKETTSVSNTVDVI